MYVCSLLWYLFRQTAHGHGLREAVVRYLELYLLNYQLETQVIKHGINE